LSVVLNRDAQVWGWFDVKANRHWPARNVAVNDPGTTTNARPEDIAGASTATERAVHGASMPLAPRLWLNIPNTLACSHRSGLKAALPGADNSRMHCSAPDL